MTHQKIEIDHVAYPKRCKSLSDAALRYIIADAREAIAANPDGPKSGYYADEINYASSELYKRQLKRNP